MAGPSVIEIDLRQLRSDQALRDGYVRRRMFGTHPTAVFTLGDGTALARGFRRWRGNYHSTHGTNRNRRH